MWFRVGAAVVYTAIVFEVVARLAFNHTGFLDRIERLSCDGARISLMHQARMAVAAGENGMVDKRMPTPLQHHPAYGWTMRPGNWESPDVRVGPLGRLPGRTALRPAAGRPWVVAYGDSFTFGDEVGDDDTWVNLVDRAWPHAVVENRGVLGWGTDQVLLRARDDLARGERPGLVLVGVNAVSLMRTDEQVGAWLKPWLTGNLVPVGQPVPNPDELVTGVMWRPWSVDLARVVLARRRPPLRSETATMILDGLWALFLDNGVPFTLVWLPQGQDWEAPAGSRERRLFLEWCDLRKAPCVDLTSSFVEAHNTGVRLLGRAHWTVAGNQLAADELVQRIQPPSL